MKKNFVLLFGFLAMFVMSLNIVSAAGVSLTNGGLGQLAANTQQFGAAVCNTTTNAFTGSVPVSITVGSETIIVSTTPSISGGQCEYTYVNYSRFGMQGGQTYSVAVTIDPQHTVISNTNNEATYMITVPGVLAQSGNGNLTATVSRNVSDNIFVIVWDWIVGLFRHW